jgi:hypothetical protein
VAASFAVLLLLLLHPTAASATKHKSLLLGDPIATLPNYLM